MPWVSILRLGWVREYNVGVMALLSKQKFSKEVIAGIVGYLTTVYIIAVNSQILSEAGIDREQAMIATILASFVGSVLVGLFKSSNNYYSWYGNQCFIHIFDRTTIRIVV